MDSNATPGHGTDGGPANSPVGSGAGRDAALSLADFRHALFNSLGVMMALAEMAKRDPAKYPRLAEVVLEKSADLRSRMLELSARFEAAFPDARKT